MRDEIANTFDAFANDGEWDHSTPWDGHHGAQISWVPIKHEGMWDDGFPVEITLTPDNLAAAFKAGLDNHKGIDGTLTTDSREDLLDSLAEWRWAIDEAEAALKAAP